MSTQIRRYRLWLTLTISGAALTMTAGCFPGQFPTPIPHNVPAPSPQGITKATPHAYGAQPHKAIAIDAGVD